MFRTNPKIEVLLFFVANKRSVNLGLLLTSSYFEISEECPWNRKKQRWLQLWPQFEGSSHPRGCISHLWWFYYCSQWPVALHIKGPHVLQRSCYLQYLLMRGGTSFSHWHQAWPLGLLFMIYPSRHFKSTTWLYFYLFSSSARLIEDLQVPEWEYRWSRATTRMWHEQKTILCYCTIEVPSNKSISFSPLLPSFFPSPFSPSLLSFPEDGFTRFLFL